MMRSSDYSDGCGGYCATTELDGKEFILSQCFTEGTHGVGEAVRAIVHQFHTIPTISVRFFQLQQAIKLEQKGIRLSSKVPAASAIVKREFGIRRNLSKAKTAVALEMLLAIAGLLWKEERGE
jgi:hypothetical protein